MSKKSTAEERLLTHLQTNGGELHSLYRVSIDIQVDYHWLHKLLCRLEASGLIHVNRPGPGKPLIIRSTDDA